MSLPKSYYGAIDEDIDIKASFKYTLSISNDNKPLLNVDVFWDNK